MCPPPLCLTVIFPLLFLPAFSFSGASSDFSGFEVVISSNPEEILDRDSMGDDQFPYAFEQGVMSMWEKIKERMIKKGFREYFE